MSETIKADEIKIEVYYGDSLLKRETNVQEVIESYIWEKDVLMLLGSEKAGKSIGALQMCAAISSGGLFLGKYKCQKLPVLYLQLEGKKDETAMRLENMMKAVSVDPNYFFRAYKKFLPLDIPEYCTALEKLIVSLPVRPKVLCLDCLYMGMEGDLNDNQAVRKFIANVSPLFERYGLTVIIVHHAKREEYFEGKKQDKGDKSSYGSVFLRAYVDHIIYLDKHNDKTRTLTCSTQRSGKVSEAETLVLAEPSPLFFKIKDKYSGSEESILWHLERANHTKGELIQITGHSESTIERGLKTLIFEGAANILDERDTKTGSKEKIYGILKNKGVHKI
jgi:RecA-family ATPase